MIAAVAVVAPALAFLPADAHSGHGSGRHGPSAAQLAAGQREVHSAQAKVTAAAAAVGVARARVQTLRTAAESAVERYDGAQVALGQAQQAQRAAATALGAANLQVASGRQRLAAYAVMAFHTGEMSPLTSVLGTGGPGTLLDQIGTMSSISATHRDTVEALTAAQLYQGVVLAQSRAATAAAAAAATRADTARHQAAAAVATASSVVATLSARQRDLRGVLAAARDHASHQQQAHLAALAAAVQRHRERQIEAAAPVQAPVSPSGGGTAPTTPPTGTTSVSPAPTAPSAPTASAGPSGMTASAATEAAAVAAAESQIGKPYQWGAAGPNSYDCSGLVMWAYARAGVSLDHYTGDQWDEGQHIPLSQLRPGDLVFFATDTSDPATIHHVGMYIGNGQMVEAPYTGANVRISSYGRPDLIGAVRPFAA